MPVPDLQQEAAPPAHRPSSRNRRPWWKRLMRAMGMGGPQDYRHIEPFRPDVAIALSEAAHRREQELRRGLHQDIGGSE